MRGFIARSSEVVSIQAQYLIAFSSIKSSACLVAGMTSYVPKHFPEPVWPLWAMILKPRYSSIRSMATFYLEIALRARRTADLPLYVAVTTRVKLLYWNSVARISSLATAPHAPAHLVCCRSSLEIAARLAASSSAAVADAIVGWGRNRRYGGRTDTRRGPCTIAASIGVDCSHWPPDRQSPHVPPLFLSLGVPLRRLG